MLLSGRGVAGVFEVWTEGGGSWVWRRVGKGLVGSVRASGGRRGDAQGPAGPGAGAACGALSGS